ncbi:OmpA family protein [Chondrinema litorale]|uniref:OmpA family protein n=1 Tax=Chondrinema litorale TaxID=2994555 RepID=UPI0025436A32|nr:OmpA family protein [Chondrinema litorale]UZR93878.1 OmpA family protein [Chondrinema litorale]
MNKLYRNPKLIFLLVLSLFFIVELSAQDISFKKSNFKSKKEAFKQALKELNLGDEYIETERDYDLALKHYLRANKFNPKSVELNQKIATCFLKGDRTTKEEAKAYLLIAQSLTKKSNIDLAFLLGEAYQYEANWDSAIISYQEVIKEKEIALDLKEKAKYKIAQCENGKNLLEKPVRVFIDNMGRGVNTVFPEYGAVFSSDFETMYFTARRSNTTGFDADTDFNYYEDIYESKFLNGRWSRVKSIDELNSSGHDAILGISPNDRKLLIYKGDNNGDIYLSKLNRRKWGEPLHFPEPINTKYREVSACYSPDGKRMFLVSDRDGSIGGLDIFVSEFKKGRGWSEPENLGDLVNTKYDEDAVFMHHDGKTLYFSSKGHNSIGGYDIFKTEFISGAWTKPVNVGIPVNTPFDDLYYFTDSTKKYAYYSTHRPDSKGAEDIYKVTFLGPEKPSKFISANRNESIPELSLDAVLDRLIFTEKTSDQVLIRGIVKSKDGNVIRAAINLEDVIQQSVLVTDTTSQKGNFSLTINTSTDYKLNVNAPGYIFYSENISISEADTLEKIIVLDPIKKGEKVVIQDIYFSSGSAQLSIDSKPSLDQILSFLKQNLTVKVELSGHTDNVGSEETNNQLSKQRAKAVFVWLRENGIANNRMRYIGKGSKFPVGDNATESGRKKNRRTELEIVQTDSK